MLVPDDKSSTVDRSVQPWVLVVLGIALCAAWGAAIWAVPHLHADPTLRTAARFVHLAALIIGFGAVLAVDWLAMLWLCRQRTLADLLQLTKAVNLPIWFALAGLVLSGLILRPDLSAWPTRIKLVLVLVIGLNGLYAFALRPHLDRHHHRPVPRRLLLRAGTVAAISQAAWWSATIIGFLNSHH